MFKNKFNNVKYINVALPVLIVLLVAALLQFVVNSINIVSQTNRDNFAYTINIRNAAEEIDKIVERAEVNVNSVVDTISQTYDANKINDLSYNKKYIEIIDPIVKSGLINSPGVNGAWFQLNIDIPFSNIIYVWHGYDNGKLVRFRQYNDRRLTPENDAYYFEAVKNKRVIWSDVYTDSDNGVKMMSICAPVYKNNFLIGVVGIDISIENLQEALKNMQNVFEDSEVFLLDYRNNVISSQYSPKENDTNDAQIFIPLFNSAQSNSAKTQEKFVEYDDSGVHKTAVMLGLSNKYNIVITFPNEKVFKGFSQLFGAIYLVFLILTVLAIFAYLNKKNLLSINKDLEVEKYKLRTIFDASPNLILVKDLNNTYIDCNNKLLEVMNLKKEDFVGKKDEDLFPSDAIEEIKLNDMIAMETGKMVVAETFHKDGFGNNLVLEKYIVPIFDSNNQVFCLFILGIDVTRRKMEKEYLLKAKEDAEKATQMKSNFLANMSHEIRTPMNGVLGFIQLLKETNPTEEQSEFILAAERASDMFLAVINDILDFSKIEAEKLQIEDISFDVRSVVEDVTIMGTTLAENKNLDVNSLICSDIPRRVFGDPARLKQILTNLVGNAIKFTHQGEVVIYVKLLSKKDGEALLSFEVKDTGIGIDEEKLNMIFDPFTQNDASTTRKYGGTGLGLAICKKLVDMKGGTISVESKVGEGSTFTVNIPHKIDTRESQDNLTDIKRFDGAKILVIDRNPTDQKIIRYYLNELNCVIYEATNPVNALSILAADNINISIILIEHKIQNETNISSIIKQNDKWKNIPLILYTSFAHKKDFESIEENNFKGFLIKPIKKQDLIETISAIINDDHEHSMDNFLAGNITKKFNPNSRVLIVEDSDINCKLISKILENHGLLYDVAFNGLDAVDAFKNNEYDVILMDCQMPIMNGYEATRQIRDLEGPSHHIPIIAMTANAFSKDEIKCHDAGMDEYVSKPLKIDKLLNVLSKYIEKVDSDDFVEECPRQNVNNEEKVVNDNERFSINDIVSGLVESIGFSQSDAIQFLVDYVGFIPDVIAEIDAAVEKESYEDLKNIAHKLKGASANLRINKISKLAEELETESQNDNMESCLGIINDLKKSFEVFNISFRNYSVTIK